MTVSWVYSLFFLNKYSHLVFQTPQKTLVIYGLPNSLALDRRRFCTGNLPPPSLSLSLWSVFVFLILSHYFDLSLDEMSLHINHSDNWMNHRGESWNVCEQASISHSCSTELMELLPRFLYQAFHIHVHANKHDEPILQHSATSSNYVRQPSVINFR